MSGAQTASSASSRSPMVHTWRQFLRCKLVVSTLERPSPCRSRDGGDHKQSQSQSLFYYKVACASVVRDVKIHLGECQDLCVRRLGRFRWRRSPRLSSQSHLVASMATDLQLGRKLAELNVAAAVEHIGREQALLSQQFVQRLLKRLQPRFHYSRVVHIDMFTCPIR